VHQELAIGAQHVDQSQIPARKSIALLRAQIVAGERLLAIAAVILLDPWITIELIQEFLQLIKAHVRASAGSRLDRLSQVPQWGM
jgi:hypothetical protein